MKKIIGIIVVVVIAFLLFGGDKDVDDIGLGIQEGGEAFELTDGGTSAVAQDLNTTDNSGESEEEPSTPVEEVSVIEEKEVKEFVVTGTPFEFSMKEIRVKKGDKVRIVFKNGKGTHDWKIDEFNAATKVIKTGEEDVVEFIADKTGTFEYYCSVGNHRAQGMVGNLIVE